MENFKFFFLRCKKKKVKCQISLEVGFLNFKQLCYLTAIYKKYEIEKAISAFLAQLCCKAPSLLTSSILFKLCMKKKNVLNIHS